MTRITRFLSVAAVAIAAYSPALAQQVNGEITLYDQPQQQDFFFQAQRRGTLPDVTATGSLGQRSSGTMPFYEQHEYVRERAEDHR